MFSLKLQKKLLRQDIYQKIGWIAIQTLHSNLIRNHIIRQPFLFRWSLPPVVCCLLYSLGLWTSYVPSFVENTILFIPIILILLKQSIHGPDSFSLSPSPPTRTMYIVAFFTSFWNFASLNPIPMVTSSLAVGMPQWTQGGDLGVACTRILDKSITWCAANVIMSLCNNSSIADNHASVTMIYRRLMSLTCSFCDKPIVPRRWPRRRPRQ